MSREKNSRQIYEFGPYQLDADNRILLRDGEPVTLERRGGARSQLTPKVIETLVALVERSGRVVGKDELMQSVWQDTHVEESNLSSNVSLLRKVLGEAEGGKPYIETFAKRGYRFNADVSEPGEGAGLLVRRRARARIVTTETEDEDALEAAPARAELPATTAATGTFAVLPFRALGAGADDDYLGLGLADALITHFSRTGQIDVRPTSAVGKYAAGDRDSVEAGRELGADAVLEGSVQRAGERLRVTVRMLSVADETPLWAEKFNVAFTDIFDVQDAIAEKVARALALKLSGEEGARLAERQTEDAEAYQLYLKGRYFWSKSDPASLKTAIEYFKQAISRDPTYARAHAGLAESYAVASYLFMSHREALPKAREAAERALELNPSLAEAHTALAITRWMYDWDWEGAGRAFRRAVGLSPNYADARRLYGMYLAWIGRFDEAEAEMRRALELDPLSLANNTYFAAALYCARRYDEAVAQCRKALEMDSHYIPAHGFLGLIKIQQGDFAGAISAFRRQRELADAPLILSQLAVACALAGETEEARALVEELIERAGRGAAAQELVALPYAALGDKERAFEWLHRAYEERTVMLPMIYVEPRCDSLRGDPRFDALLRRIGLPPTQREG